MEIIPFYGLNSGWWNIVIYPDDCPGQPEIPIFFCLFCLFPMFECDCQENSGIWPINCQSECFWWSLMMSRAVWQHHPASIGSLKVAEFWSNYCKIEALWCETTLLNDIKFLFLDMKGRCRKTVSKTIKTGTKAIKRTQISKCMLLFFEFAMSFLVGIKRYGQLP